MPTKFKVIPVSPDISIMDPDTKWAQNRIEYPEHAAYKALVESVSLWGKCFATLVFTVKFSLLLLKRIISYERIPKHIRDAVTVKERCQFLWAAVRNMFNIRKPSSALFSDPIVLESLEKNGCCVVQLDEASLGLLDAQSGPYFRELRKQRSMNDDGERTFDESRFELSGIGSGRGLFEICEDMLSKSGILGAVSMYLGQRAGLVGLSPQINDKKDSFWRNIFLDLKLSENPKTAYFHRDASGGDIKAIIYLTDVFESNGPFSYVVGSHKLEISRFDNLICEANDFNLSSTDLDARKKFAALPSKLQQKGSFGNDLSDESPLSLDICSSTWAITGKKGTLVLFDTKGIHRGGMVESGERRVLTAVLG